MVSVFPSLKASDKDTVKKDRTKVRFYNLHEEETNLNDFTRYFMDAMSDAPPTKFLDSVKYSGEKTNLVSTHGHEIQDGEPKTFKHMRCVFMATNNRDYGPDEKDIIVDTFKVFELADVSKVKTTNRKINGETAREIALSIKEFIGKRKCVFARLPVIEPPVIDPIRGETFIGGGLSVKPSTGKKKSLNDMLSLSFGGKHFRIFEWMDTEENTDRFVFVDFIVAFEEEQNAA